MKKRMLALVLALVLMLMLSMLPTAFALDAAEAPDTEHPTQGETEEVEEVGAPEEFESFEEPEDPEGFEKPEESEDPEEFEESEASEAMAAEFAAVAVNGIEPDAYLMGVHLKNGYYTVDSENGLRYDAEKPDGWKETKTGCFSYQDGVLTVKSPTTLKNNGGEAWDAVLSVRSGVLSIVCSGTLMLRGTGMTALSSDGDVLINGSVTNESIDACAVRGNLSIVNAKNVTITASASKTASNKASCDTIDGDAYIEAGGSITLKNTLSGACVNGSLRAQGHSLAINNSSADKPALTSDRDHILTTDTLTLRNNSGPAVQGDLCINVYSEKANITGRYDISGFSPNGEAVVRGSVYAKGGRLCLTNSGSIGRRRTPFESRGATARARLSTVISRSGTASCTSTRRMPEPRATRRPASKTASCRCKTAILRCAAAARGRMSGLTRTTDGTQEMTRRTCRSTKTAAKSRCAPKP